MKTGQVLEFPKSQTARVRAQSRVRNQKAALALSILSIVVLSVITNQYISKPIVTAGNRSIASVSAVPAEIQTQEIQWEHELAMQLSKSSEKKAFLAETPTLKDELLYGELAGMYGAKFTEGRLASLQLQEKGNDVGNSEGLGLKIENREKFLQKYRGLVSVPFARVGLASSIDGHETWNLISNDRTIVGQVQFNFDNEGRMISMNIE